MLKTLRYLFIICISVATFSCKKEAQTTSTLKDELVDKWYYTSIYQKDYDKNGKYLKATQLPVLVNTNYFTFNSDDTFVTVVGGQGTTSTTTRGTYKVNSLVKLTLTVDGAAVSCNLKSLAAHELIFVADAAPRVTGQSYSVIEHTLHR